MALTRTVSKAGIVSLSDLKRHLGVTDDWHDRDIEDMQTAALNVLRRWTGREIEQASYLLTAAEFPWVSCAFELPYPPTIAIQSVQYYDTAGVLQTISDYQLERPLDLPVILFPPINGTWPVVQQGRIDAVRISFTAGYTTPAPEAVHFVKLLVRHWYDNPAAVLTGTISKEVEFSLRSLANSLGLGFYADV